MKNNNNQVKEYFDNTKGYTENNYIIGLRAYLIKKYFGDMKGKSILDIGCGNGELTNYYTEKNTVTYIDISEEMLKEARRNIPEENSKRVTFICGDFLSMDIKEKFDVIILVGVVAHLNDIDKAFRKLKLLLNENGKLVIQFTNFNHAISLLNFLKNRIIKSNYKYNLNRTSRKRMEMAFGKHGFEIINILKYFPVSPLFSLFKNEKKSKYLVKLHEHKLLGNTGPENIYILNAGN